MKYYIYVDDIRNNDRFYRTHCADYIPIVTRNYLETCQALLHHRNDDIIIDLDHDLGFDDDENGYVELNGYDICRFILENQIPITAFHIHSMNPVGAHNMRQLLTHYGVQEI